MVASEKWHRLENTFLLLAVVIGFGVSMANPVAVAASITVPALLLRQTTRRRSLAAGFLYYASASWAVIPTATAFLGNEAIPFMSVFLWICAALLLAAPWMLFWSPVRGQRWWRTTLALVTGIVPPLGLIGWGSPVASAGLLFPGSGWIGVGAALAMAVALTTNARPAVVAFTLAALFLNVSYSGERKPPKDWQGMDTNFETYELADIALEYSRAKTIQQQASSSSAKVLVFPESVLSDWAATGDLFWQDTINSLRSSGKTILVGTLTPLTEENTDSTSPVHRFDFSAEIAALRGLPAVRSNFRVARAGSASHAGSYNNTIVVRGLHAGTFEQRIPVPLAMWTPFANRGARLNPWSRGTVKIGNENVAILICYEQLLTWPVLTSLLERPSLILAVGNVHSIRTTQIPACQAGSVRHWARLFGLPVISATNF